MQTEFQELKQVKFVRLYLLSTFIEFRDLICQWTRYIRPTASIVSIIQIEYLRL